MNKEIIYRELKKANEMLKPSKYLTKVERKEIREILNFVWEGIKYGLIEDYQNKTIDYIKLFEKNRAE